MPAIPETHPTPDPIPISPDFVGRVLVCENCGQGILEPLVQGRVAKTVDKPTSHVAR